MQHAPALAQAPKLSCHVFLPAFPWNPNKSFLEEALFFLGTGLNLHVVVWRRNSLPEFMDFILFGKTILVVNKKFCLFLANQLRKRGKHQPQAIAASLPPTCYPGGWLA